MKKITPIILILLTGFLAWNFFIKPYDYLVSFKAKTTAGTINQSLKIWNKELKNENKINQKNLYSLNQKININDSIFDYNWEVKAINDSLSKVKVYVTDVKNSFKNRLSILFSKTDFEKRTKNTITEFVEKLNEHLKKIKVSNIQTGITRESYCAYVSLKGLQVNKAREMMQFYPQISGFLNNNKVKFNGTPFIEVTKWNIEKDSINYNFCFPIVYNDSLPRNSGIKYKKHKRIKALKAIYNGNYITSDRAWYRLLEYAKQNNIKIKNTPIEVFYNNPNFGGDALRWKAEIYMPIKN